MSVTYWPSPSEFSVRAPRRGARPQRKTTLGPRKPLRLDGRGRRIVVKAAHAALAVTRDERAITLPVARLSRVMAIGRVDWQSEAIALLLSEGIPVVFVDAGGEPAGAALPRIARPSDLNELLEQFLLQPDWAARYDNWMRSQRFRLLRQWRRDRSHAGQPVPDAEWAEHVRVVVYHGDLGAGLAAEAYGLVITVLLRAGVRTEYRGVDGATLALATDLAALLGWRIAHNQGALRHAFDAVPSLAAQSDVRAADACEALVIEWLQRLQHCVAQWVHPWR